MDNAPASPASRAAPLSRMARAPETARRRQSRTAPRMYPPARLGHSRPEFRPLARMETGEITGPRRAGYANNPSARTTARKRNKPVSTSFIAGPRASPISKSRRRPRPRPITRRPRAILASPFGPRAPMGGHAPMIGRGRRRKRRILVPMAGHASTDAPGDGDVVRELRLAKRFPFAPGGVHLDVQRGQRGGDTLALGDNLNPCPCRHSRISHYGPALASTSPASIAPGVAVRAVRPHGPGFAGGPRPGLRSDQPLILLS